jgi:hypothetical protein
MQLTTSRGRDGAHSVRAPHAPIFGDLASKGADWTHSSAVLARIPGHIEDNIQDKRSRVSHKNISDNLGSNVRQNTPIANPLRE